MTAGPASTFEKIPVLRDPAEFRCACRSGGFAGPSSGHAPGFVQANMVVLPEAEAADFALYCERNPRPCPVLETLPPGEAEPARTARGADVRTTCRATGSSATARSPASRPTSGTCGAPTW